MMLLLFIETSAWIWSNTTTYVANLFYGSLAGKLSDEPKVFLEFAMDTIMKIVYPRVSMISLLLQELIVKLRMSVNMDTTHVCTYVPGI